MSLGSALIIKSAIGASAFDSFIWGLYSSFGYTPGIWCIIIGIVILCINAILAKNLPNIFSLFTSIIVGFFIDFWLNIISINLSYSIALYITGIILNSFGIALYTYTNIANGPIDQLMILIHKLSHKNLFISKLIMEFVLIILAVCFHGPVGIGTIFIMLLSGYFINHFYNLLDKTGGKKHAE